MRRASARSGDLTIRPASGCYSSPMANRLHWSLFVAIGREGMGSRVRTSQVAVTIAFALASASGTCMSQVGLAPAETAAQTAPDAHRFRYDGPNAETYGIRENYPRCVGLAFVRQPRCRVGAFSEFDKLFPARSIRASNAPTPFRRAATEPLVRYTFADHERTLEQYFSSRPITGLLIAKDDTILFHRYQYGRTA
jgi:hypothetical protein